MYSPIIRKPYHKIPRIIIYKERIWNEIIYRECRGILIGLDRSKCTIIALGGRDGARVLRPSSLNASKLPAISLCRSRVVVFIVCIVSGSRVVYSLNKRIIARINCNKLFYSSNIGNCYPNSSLTIDTLIF